MESRDLLRITENFSMTSPKQDRAVAPACHGEILDAVGRAKAFRLCLRRIWAVASSLPGREGSLPSLIPSPGIFPVPSHSLRHHEHEQCTFDFCEHSRVDFTSVAQRHEKGHGQIQCDGKCNYIQFVLSERTWKEKAAIWRLDGQSLLDASHPYMAISHVWADGTGAGTWGSGKVNECLWEFFCDIAKEFQCEGCWWDTISIPSDDEARVKALNNMHNNYADARITLVHDLYIREWEWIDAETACFAIVMSPWYSRGWTALELAKSHKVKIIFKSRNNKCVIKDLDVDILDQISPDSNHNLAKSIRMLRNTTIGSVGDLLAILGPRDTSKPRDLPIISGLLVGVGVSGGLSQQEIYQRILRKQGKVAQGHLFHNSATMSSLGFNWCPTNLLDMPIADIDAELLELCENGDLEGTWKVCATDKLKSENLIWMHTHPLTQVSLESALTGKDKDKYVLLIEEKSKDIRVPLVFNNDSPARALLVRFVAYEESTACCRFVGPVYFSATLGKELARTSLTLKVRIGSVEGLHEFSGAARDFMKSMKPAKKAKNKNSTTEKSKKTNVETMYFTDMGFKDWKAILYAEKGACKSLVKDECWLKIPNDSNSKPNETMSLYFKHGQGRSSTTESSQAFIYGDKDMVRKLEGWRDSDDSYEVGKLILLSLDKHDSIRVNPDDEPAKRSLAASALLLATTVLLAQDQKSWSRVEPLVTLLLNHEAPHESDSSGQCPLHLALQRKSCALTAKLLSHKTNPAPTNAMNKKRETALHLAASLTDLDKETANLLVQKTHRDLLDSRESSMQQVALHLAAQVGNFNLAKSLISQGASKTVTDSNGRTPLYYAAAGNHPQIVSNLLEYEEEPGNHRMDDMSNIPGDQGNKEVVEQNWYDAQESPQMSNRTNVGEGDMETALRLAAQKGYVAVVDILIRHCADVHAVDKEKRTALMLAAEGGHHRVIETLLRESNSFEEKELDHALLLAAKGKHGKTIITLHEGGAKSGIPDTEGMTALHWTIEAENGAGARRLIANGTGLNVQDRKDRSALILAASKGMTDVVKMLLEQEVEIHHHDSQKRTALHWAAIQGSLDVMRLLLNHTNIKNSIDEPDCMRRTALHWAAYLWRPSAAMKLILEKSPQYDIEDNEKCTPFILAAERGNLESVEELLRKKVDSTKKNKEGMTALDQVAINGHGDLVKLLVDDQDDEARMRALELAVNHKHLSVAMKLQKQIEDSSLQSYATDLILFLVSATPEYPPAVENFIKDITNLDRTDKSGRTALMLAVESRNHGLTAALLSLHTNKDSRDTDGKTALMMAAMTDNVIALKALLAAKANPKLQDDRGYTALHHAVDKGLIENVEILLKEKEVDPNVADCDRRTALHVAMEKRSRWLDVRSMGLSRKQLRTLLDRISELSRLSTQLWGILVQHGARTDTVDARGQTPLHCAALKHPEIFDMPLSPWGMERPYGVNAQDSRNQTPLFLAAENGFESTVAMLLNDGADPKICDTRGRTPLSQAAQNGHNFVVYLLLHADRLKPDLDARDDNGRTAVLLAAENGHETVLSFLLHTDGPKPDLDARDDNNRTALLLAAENGYPRVVEMLLNGKATPDLTGSDGKKAWQKAMDKGFASIVDKLLSESSQHTEDRRDINEALILASRRGWSRLAKVLVQQGADTSFQNSERCTALHMAAMNGHRKIVEILLDGQSISAIEDGQGRTALLQATEHGFGSIVDLLLDREEVKADIKGWKVPEALLLAAKKGDAEIVELVLESTETDGHFGLDLNIRDSAKKTAMALAAAAGNKEIVELLLGRHADSNIQDEHEKTALHHASWGGHHDVVEVLLKHNIDLRSALDKRGQSALHLAAERASEKVIERLLEKRANVNATAVDGQTALHRAAWGGSYKVVELLCNSGADTFIRDNLKKKPWQVAAEKGHESIVEELLRSESNLRDEHILNKQGLTFAVEMGYVGIARSLLERKAEADTKDENGLTPLHWAMARGDQAFVKLLLEGNWMTTINALDRNGQTPLCHGVLAGQAAVVKMLLCGTADPNKSDKGGRTVLHHAALKCNSEMVRILLDHKADVHARDSHRKKAWQLAAKNGGHQVVRLLLEKEPNLGSFSRKLEGLFLQMVKQGLVPMVQLLLEKKVDKNARDQFGSSALGLAAEHGNHEVLKLLLSKGASPCIADFRGKTAILWAAKTGNTQNLSLLLDAAGNLKAKMVNHQDDEGRTALLIAFEKKWGNVVKILLDKGSPEINVNVEDKKGRTALHLAAQGDNHGLVKLLLKKADRSLKDGQGKTALLLAAEQGKDTVLELLLDSSSTGDRVITAVVNSPDNRGQTALLVAAERGDRNMVEKLLQKGARKNHRDIQGRTALLIATETGSNDVVDLLLERQADKTIGDMQKTTPLRLAVANGDKELVKTFLDGPKSELEMAFKSSLQPSLSQLAVESGNRDVVWLIAEKMELYREKETESNE